MSSVLWKTETGRERLTDWYDQFLAKIDIAVARVVVPTVHGESHVLIAGPEGAPPLVALHAMRTGSSFFLSEFGSLLERFRVYAPDLPGQSIKGPDVRLSLKDNSYAVWLNEVVDGLGLDDFNLYGVSWGGFVARSMASTFPERVRRLALGVPAGIANGSHVTGLMKMAFPMIRWRVRPSEENMKKLLDPILTTWDDGWGGFMADSMNDMKLDPRIPPLATDEELAALTMPTLVLAGDLDISFPADRIVQRLSRVNPAIDVETMKDCKHCPPMTEEFRNWLGDRLSRFMEEPVE